MTIRVILIPALVVLASLAGCAGFERIPRIPRVPDTGPFTYRAETYERGNLRALGGDSTVDDYVIYGALNNPGLEAAFIRWKAALEKVPQATALPDPALTYGYFIRQADMSRARQELAVTQMFPWFGKRGLAGRVALEEANARRYEFEAQRVKLARRIKQDYFEYYYLARVVDIMEENVTLLTNLEGVARANFRSGKAQFADVIKAQVELGNLQDRLRTAKDVLRPAIAKLNAALNRASDASLPPPGALPPGVVDVNEEHAQALVIENNPELKALDAMAAKENSRIKLAKKDFYPSFSLGLGYMDMEDSKMTDPVSGMVMLNLPIWREKYRAGVREASAGYEAALKQEQDLRNNLLADLQMALFRVRDAERKIDLYSNALIPKARQALEVSQQSLEAGKAGFLDVIDAERTLLEFGLSHERARADHEQAIAEIEMIIAEELPRTAAAAPAAPNPKEDKPAESEPAEQSSEKKGNE